MSHTDKQITLCLSELQEIKRIASLADEACAKGDTESIVVFTKQIRNMTDTILDKLDK